ncbi:hypothetical protein CAPTEDRAFT_223026 [Capitella teleta]|uniref:V-type proton ATPase subunit S1 n=1 Tax=Capitella teleta TaxID=283909 RepID=R7UH74_CAPTE|nr:hypothetical protein CAPTEDRAFT_223026 [Capitella teleta]|eukprot:ELU03158.1 hypothetical protein CAPTEDRAFT_223026 [Capitella teleta]
MATMGCLTLLALFATISVISASEKAPVLLWSNNKEQALPSSLIGHTTENLGDGFMDADQNLIVFLQDKLSLDDITKHADVFNEASDGATFHHLKGLMEQHHSAYLPSVSSPVSLVQNLREKFDGAVHDVSGESLADVAFDDAKKNLVMVTLPSTAVAKETALSKIDGIFERMTREMSALKKPFTAVYTGRGSSQAPAESFYQGRHLLATADPGANYTFINLTGCIYFYMTQVDFYYFTEHWELPQNPDVDPSSDCTNGTISLILNYPAMTGLTDLQFIFEFSSTPSRMWTLDYFNLTYTVSGNSTGSGNNVPMSTALIPDTPEKFSYHCYQGPMINETGKNVTNQAAVVFTSLQVQAFNLSESFGYYNDCVGFFTIPIWTGIITTLLLVSILTFGVLMLLSIQTMDRFDDPKGKAITVNVVE